jgi:hypothetical protein
VAKEAWDKPLLATDAIRRLHIKLARTAKALKKWEKNNTRNIKMQLAIIKEVIWQLDQAQERRNLSQSEYAIRDRLKEIYLGLLAMERVRARQRSRMTNIKHDGANTKLFYLRAITHEDKEREIARHFEELLRSKHHRAFSLNWEELNYPTFNLTELEADISRKEVKSAILEMPKVNAPGPDGFLGAFYSSCWATVQRDVVQAMRQLAQFWGNNFNLLNMANIVLLPKKEMVEGIRDYCPISLVHSIAKIFSKILASRFAPRLVEMVSASQSAFVKKRCIHDNFVLVQGIAKELHRNKIPSLFLKLDIAKAFNSLSWVYLLKVLERLGFGASWRNWISLALASSSSRILLNGILGRPIKHEWGLRQDDPIFPHAIHSCNAPPTKNLSHGGSERSAEQHLTKI